MFYISDNIKIEFENLCQAFEDFNMDNKYYLDTETGSIIRAGQNYNKELEYEDSGRYYEVPKIPSAIEISWMNDFIDTLMKIEDPMLAGKLLFALKQPNPQEEFIKAIKEHDESWLSGWSQWRGDFVFEEAKLWLSQLPIETKENWKEFFESNCDCPICKAMAEGRDDEKSLKDAFREANFKQVMGDISKHKK